MKQNVCIIIPAYNEERSIGAVIDNVRKLGYTDVVVVDDGSSDRTARVARKHLGHVITLLSNSGTSHAVRTGLLYAAGRGYGVIVMMDADGQHDPSYIPLLLEELSRGARYVIGSRYILPTVSSTSLLRRIGTRMISRLLAWKFRRRIYDPTSGFRAIGKDTAVFLAGNYPAVFSEPETVMLFLSRKMRIAEVSVQMRRRMHGQSSIRFRRALYLMVYITQRIIAW